MRTRRFALALGALATGGLALRIAYVLVVGPRITLGADAVWYELQAGLIANGHGYANPGTFFSYGGVEPTAVFPPLWPLLLAAVHKLGLTSERAFQLSGAVIGSSTVVLTGLLGRRVAGNGAGLVAAGLPVLAIGVAGIVIARRRRLPVAPLLGVLAGTVFVVLVSWGNPRFRLASDPALAVFAAVAVTVVMDRTRSRPEAV